MRSVNWESSLIFENDNNCEKMVVEEHNDKEAIQLRKYEDPMKNTQRQEYLRLLDMYHDLLISGKTDELVKNLLTEDFEAFIFNSTGQRVPVQRFNLQYGLINMYKNLKIQERHVREVYTDLEQDTVCQICNYKALNEEDGSITEEMSCEIFTIKNWKISRYRASFGQKEPNDHENLYLIGLERKDQMLAKVKEINYALAGQPDLEKVASFLHDNTECKIWRWDDMKCITLNKNTFIEGFKKLEENMSIISIVPYEVSLAVDGLARSINATYVYHLEKKSSSEKFVWLCNCIYTFDENMDILKISQQGELYPAENFCVPFDIISRDKIRKIINESVESQKFNMDGFYNNTIHYDCISQRFRPPGTPNAGFLHGLKNIGKFLSNFEQIPNSDDRFSKAVDIFIDQQSTGYDVAVVLVCVEVPDRSNGCANQRRNLIGMIRLAFENGKIAKHLEFLNRIEDPIASPFDDKSFQAANIK